MGGHPCGPEGLGSEAEGSQAQGSKPDEEGLGTGGLKADLPSSEDRADTHLHTFDGDVPRGGDSSGKEASRVSDLFGLFWERPWGSLVEVPWDAHAQGLVGPLEIEGVPPGFKGGPLLAKIGLGKALQFHRYVPMQPVMGAVMFGVSGRNPVQLDAQGYPPSRKAGQVQRDVGARKRASPSRGMRTA